VGLPLDRLRPRIRPRRFFELDARPKRPFYKPLALYLGVGLAFDRGNVEYIEDPKKLGFSVEELEELALANLKRIHTKGRFKEASPGVWTGEFGDEFAAERMLLADVFDELGLDGDPIVFLPSDEKLIVVGANDHDALTAAFSMATETALEFAFVRKSGQWQPFIGEGPHAETQERRVLFHLGPAYALQAQHLPKDEPPLGDFRVHVTAGLSITVWKKGTRAWLPVTSVIELDDGTENPVAANWADIVALVPDALEPVPDVWPERYETKRFPPPDVIAKFRKDLEEPPPRSPRLLVVAVLAAIGIVLYLLVRR
jgi:hypothetical protein